LTKTKEYVTIITGLKNPVNAKAENTVQLSLCALTQKRHHPGSPW